MFARGGAVQRFQAGGPAMPMQGDPMGAAPMGAAPMQGTPVPGVPNQAQLEQMPMEQVMAAAQQSGIDPAQLEQMLGGMAGQFEGLDQAEDYEQVMNAMRGNQAPISARREELAGLVGPEDASATPESVLTLVQPVMMMAGVDQGIGGLAAEEMNTPVEGPMAEGIMSMAMPQGAPAPMPPGPPMPGMGGPAPVNFRFGGPVVAMQQGGEPQSRLEQMYQERLPLYQSVLGDQDREAAIAEQKRMTEAQILLDIAQAGLAFATPGQRVGATPAERLAESFSPALGNIGVRAGEFQKYKQGLASEDRALKLAALQSAETGFESQVEREARSAEGAATRAHDLLKQSRQFTFEMGQTVQSQDFQQSLQDQKSSLEITLRQMQGAQGSADIMLRGELEKEVARLNAELRGNQARVDFDNQLARDGIRNGYELGQMEKGNQFDMALADHKGAIDLRNQTHQQTFTAAENAVDRAQRESLQLNDQTFRRLMQEELNGFNMSESDKNRAIQNAQLALDKYYKENNIDISRGQLDVSVAAQALDEQYKLGKLAIDQAAANAVKLGSESKTNQINYLTDPARLQAYANDTLGGDTAQFEQALLDYLTPTETWDGSQFVRGARPELAREIRAAIDARVAAGRPIPTIPGYRPGTATAGTPPAGTTPAGTPPAGTPPAGTPPAGTPPAGTTPAGTPPAGTATAVTPTAAPAPAPLRLDSPGFRQELYTPEEGVKIDSPAWDAIPLEIFSAETDYPAATGIMSAPQRISNFFTEILREPFGLAPMSEEGVDLTRADKDLILLREAVLQEVNNWSDDRVLAPTQAAMRAATEGMTAGFLKFDETARSTLEGVQKQLERAFASVAVRDPEYNPNALGRYSEAQVLKARERLDVIRSLLAETRAFRVAYDQYLDSIRPGGIVTQEGVNETVDLIRGMIEANQQKQQ
jgi:hypothetical protein